MKKHSFENLYLPEHKVVAPERPLIISADFSETVAKYLEEDDELLQNTWQKFQGGNMWSVLVDVPRYGIVQVIVTNVPPDRDPKTLTSAELKEIKCLPVETARSFVKAAVHGVTIFMNTSAAEKTVLQRKRDIKVDGEEVFKYAIADGGGIIFDTNGNEVKDWRFGALVEPRKRSARLKQALKADGLTVSTSRDETVKVKYDENKENKVQEVFSKHIKAIGEEFFELWENHKRIAAVPIEAGKGNALRFGIEYVTKQQGLKDPKIVVLGNSAKDGSQFQVAEEQDPAQAIIMKNLSPRNAKYGLEMSAEKGYELSEETGITGTITVTRELLGFLYQ